MMDDQNYFMDAFDTRPLPDPVTTLIVSDSIQNPDQSRPNMNIIKQWLGEAATSPTLMETFKKTQDPGGLFSEQAIREHTETLVTAIHSNQGITLKQGKRDTEHPNITTFEIYYNPPALPRDLSGEGTPKLPIGRKAVEPTLPPPNGLVTALASEAGKIAQQHGHMTMVLDRARIYKGSGTSVQEQIGRITTKIQARYNQQTGKPGVDDLEYPDRFTGFELGGTEKPQRPDGPER